MDNYPLIEVEDFVSSSMNFIEKEDRNQIQLFATCLNDMIDVNNPIRVVDLFVDSLDLQHLGFSTSSPEGRPGYHPADLLKLYIYGYLNRMRSSRQLEKECHRNIELMWLLGNLRPDHNTIARFRKGNSQAIKKVFRQTVSLAKNFNLIGGLLIAGDSTKLRAQNSKKNNYNQKKIERHLNYIDIKLAEHEAAMAEADGDQKEKLQQEIEKHKNRKSKYSQLEQQLQESQENQISTSDTESRHQIVRNNITEVCYTLQTTVDANHNLIFDYLLTNENDKKAMGKMLRRAKTLLRHATFTALYDKGYHTGSEFKIANDLGIKTLVAIPKVGRASQAPNPAYNAENFSYDEATDVYTCPQDKQLTSNGSWYKARNYQFKQYKTRACKTCPVREQCTTAKNGKIVQRSEFTQFIENNAKQVAQNQEVYKRRQAIVEHPYGTLKRQWGFDHILTKQGKQRASADVGFMLIAYNLKRIINIMGVQLVIERLIQLVMSCIWLLWGLKNSMISHFKAQTQLWENNGTLLQFIKQELIGANNNQKNGYF